MNKVITFLTLFVFVIMPLAVYADEHIRSVDEIVVDILAAQDISGTDSVECSKVVDDQFEELGDAGMGMMIGDSRYHEVMDDMMGGEGSTGLRAMHVGMGQRYLGCASDVSGSFGMGSMMGQSFGMGGGNAMMGNFFGPWGMGGIGMLLFWIVVIVGIGFFAVWLVRQQNVSFKGKSALDILKERYAKGEIDKEEFEAKKRDLHA